MAALQSRARTQPQHQYTSEETEGASSQQRTGADGRYSRHRQGGMAAERAGGVKADDDAWILFAPPQPAPSGSVLGHAGNRAIASTTQLPEEPVGETEEDADPFQHPENRIISLSASEWQHVSSSPTEQASDVEAATRSPSAVTRYSSSGQLHGDTAGQSSESATIPDNNQSRWSAVPIPRRDTSSFFDDDDDNDDDDEDALFSDKLINDRLRHDEESGFLDENSQSIYPHAPQLRRVNQHSIKAQDGEDTDMLSLPSSLSVSDRSTSDDHPSPRFDYPDSAFNLKPETLEEEAAGSINITLTEAALSRIGRGSSPASPKEVEAGLTSGSEDEAGNEEEAALLRAPDAISAGIRPTRKKALQAIRTPSQPASAVSGGRVSSSQKSASKRRHRQSGISDKGSKRSNTSASLITVQDTRLPTSTAGNRLTSLETVPASNERHAVSPTRGRTARFTQAAKQAAWEMFSADEEVMNMMSQPGSVFSQAVPLRTRQRKLSDRSLHGLSAFSAHMASELGDSPATHGIFTALYGDDQAVDSGDETETESSVFHYHQRSRRSRRRSSFFADDLPGQRPLHTSPSVGESSLTPEQLHTASLGLHRSFTFASFQHFLIDSVYNSISTSMLGTPRSTSSNLSSSQRHQSSISSSSASMPSRKRHSSAPSMERSHSSNDLYAQSSSAEQQPDSLEYKEAVSYWRRVFRSFAF